LRLAIVLDDGLFFVLVMKELFHAWYHVPALTLPGHEDVDNDPVIQFHHFQRLFSMAPLTHAFLRALRARTRLRVANGVEGAKQLPRRIRISEMLLHPQSWAQVGRGTDEEQIFREIETGAHEGPGPTPTYSSHHLRWPDNALHVKRVEKALKAVAIHRSQEAARLKRGWPVTEEELKNGGSSGNPNPTFRRVDVETVLSRAAQEQQYHQQFLKARAEQREDKRKADELENEQKPPKVGRYKRKKLEYLARRKAEHETVVADTLVGSGVEPQ
jgi:hypothetical protein